MEKMTTEITLMSNKTMYVVKEGQLIEHELPESYDDMIVVTMNGKARWADWRQRRNGKLMSI